MKDRTPVIRRHRQAPSLTARAAAAIIAVGGLALLVCGCGGGASSSTTSAASAQANGALAFSRCMRSHGVSSFPDPNSSGQIPKDKVIPLARSPQFRVAEGACQHLLPNASAPTVTHAQVQAALSG
ncbi:MAG TPA: hypothetical protein VGK33_06715, partial [Chloroflexota bacterium]